jgi:hypothetical protein
MHGLGPCWVSFSRFCDVDGGTEDGLWRFVGDSINEGGGNEIGNILGLGNYYNLSNCSSNILAAPKASSLRSEKNMSQPAALYAATGAPRPGCSITTELPNHTLTRFYSAQAN